VKIKPGDAGWATNAVGLHFNNDFGAGLIDATAAVNMAATWTNLAAQDSAVSAQSGVSLAIPNNSSAGREILFSLTDSNITTEHVTVTLTIEHAAVGELEITLFSPSGTPSRLAELRNDNNSSYDDYTFSTVRNWGESSSGVWTLKIADRSNASDVRGGIVRAAEVKVFGVYSPPVNTPPSVRITSPESGAVFSPGVGYTINVDATDVDIDSEPDLVTKVELYENDILVGTDETAPFSFTRNPANSFYTYVAKATDSEGLVGESLPVFLVVKNQTPVISSAILNAANQAYDDIPLTVTDVTVSDPESDPITLAYKWEYSVDEENYVDSGVSAINLPPNQDNSGKLWRCAITATDGNSVSEPYYTALVNLLDRPSRTAVRPGGTYSYKSGLVLKSDTLVINRKAIIHEFSQGPLGGTAESVEILTLQAGSLSGWTLEDKSGRALKFATGVWDNIPAGTLIVFYNGLQPKDNLMPADDTDPSGGSMVIASTNTTYFAAGTEWPSLDNIGDSIFLKDNVGAGIHEISYGDSLFPLPNVGQVSSGQAAYYAGQTDAGASLANEWLRTSATAGRTVAFSDASPLDIFPGAVFRNGRYSQDFADAPGDSGTQFPVGWSSYSVQLSNTQTTNYDNLQLRQEATSAGGVFNAGSRIGILGGIGLDNKNRFDPGFFALALDNTRNLTGLKISYDVIKISEQSRSMDLNLEYTVGYPGNTSSVWTQVPGATYTSGNTPDGTLTRLINVPLPAIFQDRESPIYLRWYYRTGTNNQGSGFRDFLAIDNVLISSDSSPNIYMSLSLTPSTIKETDGSNASVGTVTINEAISTALTVGISSSDVTEATAPASVVIPAGQLSATFPIAAVDDVFSDGTQTSTITLSAPDFLNESKVLTITDNEPVLVGVTPALPNNPSNANFVDRLRTGRILELPRYYLADGSVLPAGLTLDRDTGLISGTISPTAALGTYTVVIEIRNVVGGFSSQTVVITVAETVVVSYSEWIDPHNIGDKSTTGDSDNDQLPNLVEYALNSRPDGFDNPSPIIPGRTENSISLTYTKSKNLLDVTLTAEWSETMAADSWHTAGVVNEVIVDGVDTLTIRSTIAVEPGRPTKFMRLKAMLPPPPP
jgi:subtilisin-like proprotein convertase family protein